MRKKRSERRPMTWAECIAPVVSLNVNDDTAPVHSPASTDATMHSRSTPSGVIPMTRRGNQPRGY
jgi:hypothetical protein